MLSAKQLQRLTQRIFGNAIQRQRAARGIFIHRSLMISDLMHGSHNGKLFHSLPRQFRQKTEMGREHFHVCGGIMPETVFPRKMETGIRNTVPEQVRGRDLEKITGNPHGTRINEIHGKIDSRYPDIFFKQCMYHMGADVTIGTRYKNVFFTLVHIDLYHN